jgi:diguanylate cyclase (GGDEF)-like protein/PAS domain S-box-containing protein
MKEPQIVILIDHDPAHVQFFEAALRNSPQGPFRGEWIRFLTKGFERLREKDVWAVFLNLRWSGTAEISLVDKLLQTDSSVRVVVLAGPDDELIAAEALCRGAKDYLLEGHVDSYSFMSVIRHMIEREVVEEVLFAEKLRAQTTLDSIGDGVLCTDILGQVTYLNAVAEAMTGWPMNEALGRPLVEVFDVVDGVTREPILDPMRLAINKNKTVALAANSVLVRRDGYESPIEDSASPIHDRSGKVTGAVIVFHDMEVSRTRAGELKHLAEHDVLTGLPNRLLLTDRLNQAIAKAHRQSHEVAILFLDLDQFKQINDSLGHVTADKLLQSVSARLLNCLRASDTVCRYGGDEFVILLSDLTHGTDADVLVMKIVKALTKVHDIDGHRLHMTASIGMSIYPGDALDSETLIAKADDEMYRAKEKRRITPQFPFSPERSQIAIPNLRPHNAGRCKS